MDKTQKIVVALLIVAVVFSVVSMISSIGLSNIGYDRVDTQPTIVEGVSSGNSAGGVGVTVESNRGVGQ